MSGHPAPRMKLKLVRVRCADRLGVAHRSVRTANPTAFQVHRSRLADTMIVDRARVGHWPEDGGGRAMPRKFSCPGCRADVWVGSDIAQALIRCPTCARLVEYRVGALDLLAGRAAEVSDADDEDRTPDPPPEWSTLLTAPHTCSQCRAPIRSPIGCRAATISCPSCGNRTSLYAVIFLCDSCGDRLESPSRRSGDTTTCPSCLKPVRVPYDLLHADLPEPPDSSWFQVECPGCRRPAVSRKQDVGKLAVCPHCSLALEVPFHGESLGTVGRVREHDPLESLHPAKSAPCPSCRTPIPLGSAACPFCGRAAP
jgi:hypothetical protein